MASQRLRLLTPGPITLASEVKLEMVEDRGSRDPGFTAVYGKVHASILEALHLTPATHTPILLQGSGTFAVESMLSSVPAGSKILFLVNGAYGRRMLEIAQAHQLTYSALVFPEDEPVDLGIVTEKVAEDPLITHLALIHHETTSGVLNDIEGLRARCPEKILIVDAMSSMGGVKVDWSEIDIFASSSGKCFEGPPGLGVVIVKNSYLGRLQSRTLSLDLMAQHLYRLKTEQSRFTPPTHIVMALGKALEKYLTEGGVEARQARYQANARMISDHLEHQGFRPFLRPEHRGWICNTFYVPSFEGWNFETLYQGLIRYGFAIYPGKVTKAETFRIGSIGALDVTDVREFLECFDRVIEAMQAKKAVEVPKVAPKRVVDFLAAKGLTSYVGVPDSLLGPFVHYILDNVTDHTVAVNEGSAIGIAAGQYLATQRPSVVYLQNSGLGNAINPLVSLAHPKVYGLPMLLVIGWRGEPGTHDEPQHMVQGASMVNLIRSIGLPYGFLNPGAPEASVERCLTLMKEGPACLIVSAGTFADYTPIYQPPSTGMRRAKVLGTLAGHLGEKDLVVCTTGKSSRELNEAVTAKGLNPARFFLTVGSMGHASSIALGLGLKGRKVWCYDGDGACLMHLGAMTSIGTSQANIIHLVINNGTHESVGVIPTQAQHIDLATIARGCGYREVRTISTPEELEAFLAGEKDLPKPLFVDLRVGVHPSAVSRPSSKPKERSQAFIEYIRSGL